MPPLRKWQKNKAIAKKQKETDRKARIEKEAERVKANQEEAALLKAQKEEERILNIEITNEEIEDLKEELKTAKGKAIKILERKLQDNIKKLSELGG